MTSASIRSRIQAGLAKAVKAVGSSAYDKVYLVQKTYTSTPTPVSPVAPTETLVELVNAVFQSYATDQIVGSESNDIRVGDRKLVSDHSVEIKEGYIIRQGSTDYIVVSTDTKAPTSDTLLYISQVRVK